MPHGGTIQYGVAYKLGRKWLELDALSSLL